MKSRKEVCGKARRAPAKAKAATPTHTQHKSLKVQGQGGGHNMQMIGALKRDGAAKCDHGLVPSHYQWQSQEEFRNTSNNMMLCRFFLQAFVDAFDGVGGDFIVAYQATKEEYADVWKDLGRMAFVVSFLLSCGTSKVLEGNIKVASKYASLGSYFEQYVEVNLLNTRACPNFAKIKELYLADIHTLVSFLRKRIPCSCLDEKYKEVKSMPKIGLCCNPGCPLPGGMTERSLTMCCSRCRGANYCSRECQVAAWQGHRGECDFYADLKSKFESEQE